MTLDDVHTAFKSGNGKAIAETVESFFKERIASGKYRVVEYYKANKNNINGQNIVETAQQIFSV